MAEDLKPMLGVVLKGQKKFFFAYGTGKRKDGKGDGLLLVDRKKPKKEDVAEGCDCQQFFEGWCWSSVDNGTIYFQGSGKNLSQAIVAKMALSAKRETGKQYDFQLPSSEEEARAASLNGESETKETESTEPTSDAAALFKKRLVVSKQRFEELKTADPARSKSVAGLFMQAVSLGQAKQYDDACLRLDEFDKQCLPRSTPPPPATDGAATAYKARAKALAEPLKKAIVSKAPTADEAKLRFTQSQAFAGKNEFAKANLLLDQVEKLLGGAPKAPTTEEKSGDDASRFKTRLQALLPDIQQLVASKTPQGGEVKQHFADANDLARGKDFVKANAALDKIESLLKQKPVSSTDDAATRFTERLKAMMPELTKAQAGDSRIGPDIKSGVSEAMAFARKKDYEQGNAVLDRLAKVLAQGPDGQKAPPPPDKTETVSPNLAAWQKARAAAIKQLRDLREAIDKSGDPEANRGVVLVMSIIKNLTESPTTPQQIAELRRYLQKDDVVAAAEEARDEFGKVHIRAPLLKALAALS